MKTMFAVLLLIGTCAAEIGDGVPCLAVPGTSYSICRTLANKHETCTKVTNSSVTEIDCARYVSEVKAAKDVDDAVGEYLRKQKECPKGFFSGTEWICPAKGEGNPTNKEDCKTVGGKWKKNLCTLK